MFISYRAWYKLIIQKIQVTSHVNIKHVLHFFLDCHWWNPYPPPVYDHFLINQNYVFPFPLFSCGDWLLLLCSLYQAGGKFSDSWLLNPCIIGIFLSFLQLLAKSLFLLFASKQKNWFVIISDIFYPSSLLHHHISILNFIFILICNDVINHIIYLFFYQFLFLPVRNNILLQCSITYNEQFSSC